MERETYRQLTGKIVKSSRLLSVVLVSALNFPQIHQGSINNEPTQRQISVISRNHKFPEYPKLQASMPELNNLSPEARRRRSPRT